MVEVEVYEVAGEQTPPLAGGQRRSVIAQRLPPRLTCQHGQQQQCASGEQSPSESAVAIERLEQPDDLSFSAVHRSRHIDLL